jgi:drug/metabolite transporter (DMT)-like permease
MSLHLVVALLMLLAAAMHAGWNLFVKGKDDRLSAITAVMSGGAILAALALPFVDPPARASWIFIFLSIAIHLGYYGCLVSAYRHGDLSHAYPIARGSAPLLVAIAAAPAAGEWLSPIQCVGVALISLGIVSLAFERGFPKGDHGRSVLFALGTAVFIMGYSVTDGLGVRRSGNALGYILWLFALEAIPLLGITIAIRRRTFFHHIRDHWQTASAGAVLSCGAYGLAIWGMSVGTLAGIVSLRETSVLFGAAFGAMFLSERFGWRRILAAIAVVGGNLLLQLA